MVRAKFYVYSVTEFVGNVVQVVLMPVTGSSEENKAFWQYTPSGKLEMSIKGEAADMFNVGQEFYIDFSPAEIVSQ